MCYTSFYKLLSELNDYIIYVFGETERPLFQNDIRNFVLKCHKDINKTIAVEAIWAFYLINNSFKKQRNKIFIK